MFGLLFDEVDKDKNGSVTLQELKLRMQPAVSRHDIKHFVQVINRYDHQTQTQTTSLWSYICRVWLNQEEQNNSFDIDRPVPSKHQTNREFFPRLARVASDHCKF